MAVSCAASGVQLGGALGVAGLAGVEARLGLVEPGDPGVVGVLLALQFRGELLACSLPSWRA